MIQRLGEHVLEFERNKNYIKKKVPPGQSGGYEAKISGTNILEDQLSRSKTLEWLKAA